MPFGVELALGLRHNERKLGRKCRGSRKKFPNRRNEEASPVCLVQRVQLVDLVGCVYL